MSHRQGSGDPLLRSLGPGTIVLDDENTPPGVSGVDAFEQYCSGQHASAGASARQPDDQHVQVIVTHHMRS